MSMLTMFLLIALNQVRCSLSTTFVKTEEFVSSSCLLGADATYWMAQDTCEQIFGNAYRKVTCAGGSIEYEIFSDSSCTTYLDASQVSALASYRVQNHTVAEGCGTIKIAVVSMGTSVRSVRNTCGISASSTVIKTTVESGCSGAIQSRELQPLGICYPWALTSGFTRYWKNTCSSTKITESPYTDSSCRNSDDNTNKEEISLACSSRVSWSNCVGSGLGDGTTDAGTKLRGSILIVSLLLQVFSVGTEP